MRYFFLYIVISLFYLINIAQGNHILEGVVTDYDNNPVDKTKIKLHGVGTTYTNNGSFKFENVTSGEYALGVYNNSGEVVHEQYFNIINYLYIEIKTARLPTFTKIWMENVYSKRMDFFLGKNYLYKFLDESKISIIEPELTSILKNAEQKIIEFLQTEVTTTKSVQVGTYFDEDKYLTHLLAESNPSQADANRLKMVYTYPQYDEIKQSNNREIKIDKLSYQKTPKWSEIVKYVGGYSKLAEKGISKEKIGYFTLTEKLESIEVIDEKKCKAHFKIYGKNEAFNFYNQKEKSRVIPGKIIIPKINYSNLDKVDIRYDLGKGELKGRLITISKRYQKEMKSTIKTMFDDLVSKDEFDNVLFNNPKTKKYSKKWIIAQNKEEEKGRAKIESDLAKIESDLIETNFTIDSKLVSISYYVNLLNSISIEQKKVILEALENENEKYYKYAKLTILGLGFLYVEDLMMIKSGAFFKKVIDAKPKSNFGDKFYYSFDSTDLGSIIKIETPKKEIKKSKQLFKKRTKWKLVYPKD